MTFLVIALQFLVVFAVNIFFMNKLLKENAMISGAGWAILGGTISAVIALISCAYADEFGVSIFANLVTVGLAYIGGIAAAVGWDIFVAKAFKNLHQLT